MIDEHRNVDVANRSAASGMSDVDNDLSGSSFSRVDVVTVLDWACVY